MWRIVNEFDTTAGCWASMPLLAQLTGIPCDRFIEHVETLKTLGLIADVQQGTIAILFATLPAIGLPGDATLEREDKLLCAGRLDRHIAEVRLSAEVRLPLQPIPGKELPANERDCSPALGSPAVNCSLKTQASEQTGQGLTAVPSGVPPQERISSVPLWRPIPSAVPESNGSSSLAPR